LLCAGKMQKDDFVNFTKFLMKLFLKHGAIADQIIYSMVQERPKDEKDSNLQVLKSLNSDKKFKLLMDGLVHQSSELREIAISRIKIYNKYDENILNKFLVKKLNDEKDIVVGVLSVIGKLKNTQNLINLLVSEFENTKFDRVKERASTVMGNLIFETEIDEKLKNKITISFKDILNQHIPKEQLKEGEEPKKRSDQTNSLISALAVALYKISKRGDKEVSLI
jgi:hypothetical protein